MSLTGTGTLVDSFDSGVGQKGSANQGSEASLFSNGKTSVEAMRCLKRRLSDLVYRQMLPDALAPSATGP